LENSLLLGGGFLCLQTATSFVEIIQKLAMAVSFEEFSEHDHYKAFLLLGKLRLCIVSEV